MSCDCNTSILGREVEVGRLSRQCSSCWYTLAKLQALEALLVAYSLWSLALDYHLIIGNFATSALNHLQGVRIAHLVGFVERGCRVCKIYIFGTFERSKPFLRNIAISESGSQNTSCRSRVAIGVLTATSRDVECTTKIALAIEESYNDVGTIHRCVDVERSVCSLGAEISTVQLLVAYLPALFPVVGILTIGFNHAADEFVELALLWDCLQTFTYDCLHVVGHKCQRIHSPHINSAIPAITIVHNMAYAVGNLRCRVGHCGSHNSCVVGLDLVVDVVGVRIVVPVARHRGHNSSQNVVASSLVGVPKVIACVGVCDGNRIDGHVNSPFVECLDKG